MGEPDQLQELDQLVTLYKGYNKADPSNSYFKTGVELLEFIDYMAREHIPENNYGEKLSLKNPDNLKEYREVDKLLNRMRLKLVGPCRQREFEKIKLFLNSIYAD